MACETVDLGNGQRAIVCGARPKRKKCACGRPAGLACDWKTAERKSGTCDVPICGECSFSPAEGKDLCPEHKAAYDAWLAAKASR